jgi:hypothetical protein
MKHTYIFKLSDTLNEDDLYRLAFVADQRHVSWKGEMSGSHYKWVQVFTDPASMHDIAARAMFSSEQLRLEIPRARLNGDEAYAKSQSKLNALRRKRPLVPSGARKETKPPAKSVAYVSYLAQHGVSPVRPAWSVVTLERLRRVGCDVTMNLMSNGFEIIVFGEAFTMLNEDEARGFLIGLERGFREISDTRDLYKSVLALIKNYAEVKNSKGVIQIVDAALVDPSAPGSPQMGSTKATKRSKRSC